MGVIMKNTIACFGDSLVFGFPFGKEQSWLAKIHNLDNDITLLNYGECGASCDDILANMKGTTLTPEVKYIMFLGGANDVLQNRPVKVIMSDVQKAIMWATDRGYLFALVLPWLTAEASLNIKIEELRGKFCAQFSPACQIFDLQPAIGFNVMELSSAYLDGVHPTTGTYDKIGEYAGSLIKLWLRGGKA
jgi:acyl-CoA thioesterase I